jgi:hypothetical protein
MRAVAAAIAAGLPPRTPDAKSAAESKAKDAEIVLRKSRLDTETFNVLLSSWDQKRTDLPSQGGLDIYVANSATQLCSAIEQHGDSFGRPVAWIPLPYRKHSWLGDWRSRTAQVGGPQGGLRR